MEQKKKVMILTTIAIILAITAITMNLTDSNEVSTERPEYQGPTGAVIGVKILPTEIEDKLANEETLQP